MDNLEFINDKIYRVKLEFSDSEWVDLLNKEGEWLGACCADISRIRDILGSAIREDGWVKAQDLGEMVSLLDGHHEVSQDNPLYKAKNIWDQVKDNVEESYVHSGDPDNLREAFNMLYVASSHLSWEWLSSSNTNTEVCEIYNFYRVLPAIKLIYEKLASFDKELDGYIVCKKDGTPIITRHSGWAFYDTIEKAKIHFGKEFNIHKARISLKNGLEKL